MSYGKPKYGYYFDNMKRTRALFKLALRYCRDHIDELKADACAENLFDKDCRKFWNSVYKISNNKVSKHVDCVGGATGPQEVANMWKNHFDKLYNSTISKHRQSFVDKINDFSSHNTNNAPEFTVMDVMSAISKQKGARQLVQMDYRWKHSSMVAVN